MDVIVWCNHSNESSLALLLLLLFTTALTFENEHSSFYFAVKIDHPYLPHLITTKQTDNVLPQKKKKKKIVLQLSIVVFSLIIILRKR